MKAVSADPLAQYAAVAGPDALPRIGTAQPTPLSILQRKGRSGLAMQRWPQAPRDRYNRLDFEQDWTNHKPISRSSVKPRDARDYIINESWLEPGGAEISCAGLG